MKIGKYKWIFVIILIVFILFGIFFLANNFAYQFSRNLYEKIFMSEPEPFQTSQDHRQRLGIEIIKLPLQEEEEIHSMIKEYYETRFVSEFEEGCKKELLSSDLSSDREKYLRECLSILSRLKIEEIKFSQPRRYEDLKDRIGMMAYISKTDPPNFLADSIYSYPMHIFVFKRINDFKRINERWELEKARERFSKIEADEEQLIADLLHKEKLGIEEIQLPLEEEREIHSIIEREYKSKVIEDYKKISPQLPKDLKISKVEFSQPRKYRDLEDRIGIISYISETEPPGYGKGQEWEIFILKKTNNKWAIERKIVGSHDFYKDEENLIQEMKAGLL